MVKAPTSDDGVPYRLISPPLLVDLTMSDPNSSFLVKPSQWTWDSSMGASDLMVFAMRRLGRGVHDGLGLGWST